MCGLHFSVDAGPGSNMSPLNATDAGVVEAAILADFWTPLKPLIADDWTLKEVQWTHFGADFPRDKNGVCKYGPPWRVTALDQPGTGTGARLPDQVCLTSTYRTASRKHWGRNYWGGWASTSVLSDSKLGHPAASTVDGLASSVRALLVDLNDNARSINMWVWSPVHRGALTVKQISVDDTWDVQRRRRSKSPTYRHSYSA